MAEVTSKLSMDEEVGAPKVALEEVVAPEVLAGTQIQASKVTLEKMAGVQIQAPELTSEEVAGAQIQVPELSSEKVVSAQP